MPPPEPSAANDWLLPHARLLLDSFERLVGRPLVDPAPAPPARPRALYEAPFVADATGAPRGQAATFDRWTSLDAGAAAP